MQQTDWTVPQRQPAAALVIVLVKTVWGIIKSAWPVLLIMLFRKGGKDDDSGGVDRYEIIALAVSVLALVLSFVRWWFFRFHIHEGQLVVQKGWLQKETVMVPFNKIQSLNAEAGPLHQLLGVTKLSVDTAGDTKTELSIDAVHQYTVTALQEALQTDRRLKPATSETEEPIITAAPVTKQQVLQLGAGDLLKLSLSANHLETAAIVAAFGFRLFDDLRQAGGDWLSKQDIHLPEGSVSLFLLMAVAVLMAIIFVSSLRIFLKYFGFTVQRSAGSFFIKQGLLQVRQREVAFKKISAVTWRANALRYRLGLWLTEFVLAGGENVRKKQQVEIPVTNVAQITELVTAYHTIPAPDDATGMRIHSAFIYRRVLFLGLLPAVLVGAAIVYWAHWQSLLLLLWPLIVGINSWRKQKTFRAYIMEDVLYLNRSVWGRSFLLLQWQKLQKAELRQGPFAQRRGLAHVLLYHPGGIVVLPYINIQEAQALVNFVLYKVETDEDGWQ